MSSVEQQLTAMQEQMAALQAQLAQVNILHMDVPIHTSKPMTTPADRRSIIEAYPSVAQLEYRSPATVPSAEQSMNKGHNMEDNSLKHLQ
ncbi:hypothetical protein PS6_011739 [Mucor atramentarius]